MKLQVNTSGAWKNVVDFDNYRREAVIEAVRVLAAALGNNAKWCLLNNQGEREWLKL